MYIESHQLRDMIKIEYAVRWEKKNGKYQKNVRFEYSIFSNKEGLLMMHFVILAFFLYS